MSDKANTPWVGPTSKDAHSGGKTLGKRLRCNGIGGGTFTNSTEQARSAFKGMKFENGSTAGLSPNVKGALTSKPSKK